MASRGIQITTPEYLVLHFERAGLATRAAAICIDVLVIGTLLQVTWWALAPFEAVSASAASALWIVAAFVLQWGYGATLEWRFGSTLGKRLLGIQVVDRHGLPLNLAQAMVRNLLRIADLLPLLHLAGAATALLDARGRRLGDLGAQTMVVLRHRQPWPIEPFSEELLSRRQTAEFVRLAKRLTISERQLLTALQVRRSRLQVVDRIRLYEGFFAHLAATYDFVADQHMSGERFLLSLASALSEQKGAQES